MILKRISSLNKCSNIAGAVDNAYQQYLEVTRSSNNGLTYSSYKVSMSNFLKFLREAVKIKTQFSQLISYTNLPLGTVSYMTLGNPDKNYVIADGSFYSPSEVTYLNVTKLNNVNDLYNKLVELYNSKASNVIYVAANNMEKISENKKYDGCWLIDTDKKIFRVPNLIGRHIKTVKVLSETGTIKDASLPNILGDFDIYSNNSNTIVLKQIVKNTSDDISITTKDITKTDENFPEAKIDMGKQDEKYSWASQTSETISYDASKASSLFKDDFNTVEVDSIKYIPYILINNRKTINIEVK